MESTGGPMDVLPEERAESTLPEEQEESRTAEMTGLNFGEPHEPPIEPLQIGQTDGSRTVKTAGQEPSKRRVKNRRIHRLVKRFISKKI